ncbi:alpha/beta hydrolase [Stenoxybacter acetivorans]|uniref:alpha/beta hydrolase n=1 Tax=Stenoxybacter acetivorans TaxID=422441 RepID=UPI00055B9E4C|nr:alpha/beta fold hydrolase [Stenoxybacter acetivorans]
MLNTQNIIFIHGPAGRLQTIYIAAQGEAKGVAVINHPNPLQGGTFINKVIQTAAKALSSLGFHCYLPNLRGVGESEGEHDFGRGETEDCLAVLRFAQTQHPDVSKHVLAGFSFGGYVALFAAEKSQPDALLLLGPAVGVYQPDAPLSFNPKRTLLIHGETDKVVPLQNSLDWANKQIMPIVVVPQTGHFFHGKLIVLREWIEKCLPGIIGI